MISPISGFRFIDRRRAKTMLLIPGWATDYRIFDTLDLPFNYLIADDFLTPRRERWFSAALDSARLDKVSVLGWSMGAYFAQGIALKHRERVSDITLVSARKKYERRPIEAIKGYVEKNKDAFLYKFYQDFFSASDRELSRWFRGSLLKAYMKEMDRDLLIEGLEHLATAHLEPECFEGLPVKIFHGTEDRIAPFEEAFNIKHALPSAQFFPVEGTGHLPFLSPQFKEAFANDE